MRIRCPTICYLSKICCGLSAAAQQLRFEFQVSSFESAPFKPEPRNLKRPSFCLCQNLADRSCAHRASTFADSEPQTFFHGDGRNQLNDQRHVVSGHHHLRAARQLGHAGHIRRPEIELWTIALEEWRM